MTRFPDRLAAIIVPTLRVMERLRCLGISDYHYTFYQARAFLIWVQRIDPRDALQISQHMKAYIRDYIRAKYPHLEWSISFEFDRRIKTDAIEKVRNILEVSDSPDMRKIIWYAESKWKSRESAYLYAAANIVCNLYSGKAHHIVMWWEKERPFFRMWQAYEASIPDSPESSFVIQSTWHIPPYYPQIWGESYFDMHWSHRDSDIAPTDLHIRYDLSTL